MDVLIVATFSGLIVGFGLTGYLLTLGLNFMELAGIAVFWGVGISLLSLFLSKPLVKLFERVEVLSPEENLTKKQKRLINTVNEFYEKAGLEGKPEVGVYPSKTWNAFAIVVKTH